MKNKIKFLIFFVFFTFFFSNLSFSNEVFNFDVTELEIKENGNRLIGKNSGSAKSLDGTTIKAKNFIYDKIKNILTAYGDVEIYDPLEELYIFSNKITYFKNDELIFSEGNSKAIDEDVQIDARNFEYNKLSNILNAEGKVKINNKKENYLIYSDKITYNKNLGNIFTKNNSRAISENLFLYGDEFEYNQKKNVLIAKGNVKLDDRIEDYILETDYINYEKNLDQIFTIGNTKILFESKYDFISKNIFLDRNLKEIKSDYPSKLKDDNSNFYELSKFLYFYEKKFLKGENIKVETNYQKSKSDQFYFKNAFINFLDGSFVSKNTEINLHKNIFDKERELKEDEKDIFKGENDPRIYGASSIGDKDKTVLNKAIFTSCKKNNDCPAWSIKADKITHDKKNQNVHYKNAILNIYDVPVFYFPKFFHPDPSVERRSGLLQPRLNNSNVLGSSIQIPYFKVISENRDITFKPTIFDNRIYMFQNEYRQENENSSFIADFSYTKGYQSKRTASNYDNRNSISHLFSKFDLDFGFEKFNTSKLKIFLEKVNNDTYLKVFENVLVVDKEKFEDDLKDKNNLTSGLELILDDDNFNFTTGLTVYENLQEKNNDRFQHVLPYYDFSTTLFSNQKGKLNFKTVGRNTLQNTNNLRSNITNTLDYTSSDIFAKNGFVNNFGIYFKNLNATGKNDAKYKSSLQTELTNIYEFNTRFPLSKENSDYLNYITPKISFRINPSDMKNHSSESRLITTNNIFDINRLGISDSYESGKSLTVGVDFKKEDKNNLEKYLEVKFATVFKDKENKQIPTSSSLNRTTSNLFGSIENSFSEFFTLSYDFAIDNDLNKVEYNSIETEFSVNNFVTTFNFLEKAGETGDVNTIENTTKISLDDHNSLLFKSSRNRKISLTEYYDLVYEYQNDCLTAGIKYRKTYYQDRDLKPKEDLFFTITLFPLTSLDQKVDNSLYRN